MELRETQSVESKLWAAAVHEAHHGVMRWLRGLTAANLTVNDDGTGLCLATRPKMERALSLIDETLAGIYAEVGGLWQTPEDLPGLVAWVNQPEAECCGAAVYQCDVHHALELLADPMTRCRWNCPPCDPPVDDLDGHLVVDPVTAFFRHLRRVGDELSPHYDFIECELAPELAEKRFLPARRVAAMLRGYGQRLTRWQREEQEREAVAREG